MYLYQAKPFPFPLFRLSINPLLDIGYLNPTTTEKYQSGYKNNPSYFNEAGRKLREKQRNNKGKIEEVWWLSEMQQMQAGDGSMAAIANILAQRMTKSDKIKALKKAGLFEKVQNIKKANKAAFTYLMQKAVAVVANDPSKLPGFLTWVGVSGSLG